MSILRTDRLRWSTTTLHAALYFSGLLFYAYILSFGRGRFDMYDWPLFMNFAAVLKTALLRGVMPFHAYIFREDAGAVQTEYFARPFAVLAPHVVVLLRFASVKAVALLHVLIAYSTGYLALWKLCRHNHLDRMSFASLYGLFLFGAFIPSKLVVGHIFDASSYFLLPFLLLYVQRLLDASAVRQRGEIRDAVIKLSLILVYTTLQAGLHVLWIELLIVALTLLFHSRPARRALGQILLLLSLGGAVRFVPILALGFNDTYLGQHPRLWAVGGYGSWWQDHKLCSTRSPTCWLSDFADALTVFHPIQYHDHRSWWEFNLYIGLAGVVMVVAGLSFFLVTRCQALDLTAVGGGRGA